MWEIYINGRFSWLFFNSSNASVLQGHLNEQPQVQWDVGAVLQDLSVITLMVKVEKAIKMVVLVFGFIYLFIFKCYEW